MALKLLSSLMLNQSQVCQVSSFFFLVLEMITNPYIIQKSDSRSQRGKVNKHL